MGWGSPCTPRLSKLTLGPVAAQPPAPRGWEPVGRTGSGWSPSLVMLSVGEPLRWTGRVPDYITRREDGRCLASGRGTAVLGTLVARGALEEQLAVSAPESGGQGPHELAGPWASGRRGHRGRDRASGTYPHGDMGHQPGRPPGQMASEVRQRSLRAGSEAPRWMLGFRTDVWTTKTPCPRTSTQCCFPPDREQPEGQVGPGFPSHVVRGTP